jgi:hypothetical protein
MPHMKVLRQTFILDRNPRYGEQTFTVDTGKDSGTILGVTIFGTGRDHLDRDDQPTPVSFASTPVRFSPENPFKVTYVKQGDISFLNHSFTVRVVYLVDE